MIIDKFENIHQYVALNKGFLKAVDFLSNLDLMNLQENKYEIDGDRVYAMVSKDAGRNKKDAQLEIHSKYIDIQLVLEGTDEMGWKSAALCKHPAMEFDKEADIQLFHDEPEIWFPVKPGFFVVFFPKDAHMPLISDGRIHKVVVKISEDLE
jgi:biofilm protein TabA